MQSAATPTASTSVPAVARRAPASLVSDRVLGILLMAALPALFWTGVAAGAAALLDIEIQASTLLQAGAAIGLFLAVIAAAVISRAN